LELLADFFAALRGLRLLLLVLLGELVVVLPLGGLEQLGGGDDLLGGLGKVAEVINLPQGLQQVRVFEQRRQGV